ncbi:hypothetical protein [Luteibacter sp. CQ10]|uniref:hypothetical protein n=1 Tax=Luteibacter sp. CQ10 TaxID=2805821 RepID=UPI0034A5551F
MRKIAAAEMALLIGAMVVGSAHADDSCELTGQICNEPLDTVWVDGWYSPTSVSQSVPDYYILPNGNLLSSSGFDGIVRLAPNPLPTAAQQEKLKNCVAAYGRFGVNPGYSITFKQFFTWALSANTGIKLSSPSEFQPNSGDHWGGLAAVTHHSPDSIVIYEQGWGTTNYGTMAALFDTLAHEESHAFGIADEGQAAADAQAAYARFVADNGAKCGGPF